MSRNRVAVASLHLNENHQGVARFFGPFAAYWNSVREISLDFSTCKFLNAEGAAILAAFIIHRREWGGRVRVDWNGISSEIRNQLGRWRLMELLEQRNFPWTGNAIPLLHQRRLDARAVVQYIETHVQAGANMPAMTPALVKEMNCSLCELFVNVFDHAESPCGGLAIGQYYPNTKRVQICVCDSGLGLARKVQREGHFAECDGSAIHWALEEGHSTKSDLPGGLGLFTLREFVKCNQGSLRILANKGCCVQQGESLRIESLPASFPGTLIQLGLLIRSDEVYTIQDEEDRF